ncbi:hypothetical protein J3L14_17855 [Burkholderia pseudomallei]|uniref:hypothetical protein n=1 Tax=Burkholderia pseudomallei TaxID=28450 RepID=UPI001A9E3ED4|nr:hypothetical protein [Burkholderia pseudomallei]QTB79308.1 hypothetical protein J3L14_17855 [Burkholderia pseudomallei]
MQTTKMVFCPLSGERGPVPDIAAAWREQHRVAWMFNPWTGEPRGLRDIEQDVDGRWILPPGEQMDEEWDRHFIKLCRADGALGQLRLAGWSGMVDMQQLVVTIFKDEQALIFRLTDPAEEERFYTLLHDEAWRRITS